jgi:hypothetical protein
VAAVAVNRLPDGYRTLRLSTEVRQSFDEHLEFDFFDGRNAGVLYGRTSACRELVVEYVAPFFLDLDIAQKYKPGYAFGRAEALYAAVWQLRGLWPIGYWLAYDGGLPAQEQVLEHLETYAKLGLEISEFALLIATRSEPGKAVIAAYTYAARQPVSAWRSLTCR